MWLKVTENNVLDLNMLSSGNCCLLLCKKEGIGKNKYVTKEVSFSITTIIYEAWLFKLLHIAFLPVLIYSILGLCILFITLHKVNSESETLKKTQEQQALIDNLKTTVLALKRAEQELRQKNFLKEDLALVIAHDLRSQQRFMLISIKRLCRKLITNDINEARVLGLELKEAIHNTYFLIEDFTCWQNSLNKDLHPQFATVNLYNLFNELSHFFTELFKMKGNRIDIAVDKSLCVNTDGNLLKIILRNIIDNANRYTSKGIISISGNIKHSNAFITIKDNGEGIKEDVLKKIRLYKEDGLSQIDHIVKLNGNGYKFIKHFCNLLAIEFEVNSKLGKGTAVKLINIKI